MATLEKIRNRAGCLIIVIGLGLVAFLFGDFLNGCASVKRDQEMTAFTVNGEKVQIYEYEDRVRQVQDMEAMMGRNQQSRDEMQSQQLRNQVYANMVAEQVLEEESEKVGLYVSGAETFDLVQGEHISPVILQNQMFMNPETGVFDKAGLLNFLKQIAAEGNYPPEQQAQINQLRSWWVNTENSVRDFRLLEKYTSLVASAVVTNELEVKFVTEADATAADLAYVEQKASDATDLNIEVTKSDLKKYYDNHKEFFRTEEGMNVDIIYANIHPSESDFAQAREAIGKAREELLEGEEPVLVLDEYSDAPYFDVFVEMDDFGAQAFPQDFLTFLGEATPGDVSQVFEQPTNYSVAKLVATKTAPKNLKVSHIVLAPAGSFEGQVDADSLLVVLKANPGTFAEEALAHSLDKNSAQRGGEIGWLTEAMATQYIDADFSEAIYGAKVGEPFAYTSKYGEHLILVSEAGESVKKYKVAYANRQVTPSTETESAIYTDMANFLESSKGEDIEAVALNAGYQILQDVHVNSSQPVIAQGINNSRSLVHWGMTQKAGAVSDITETGDKYVIVRVNNVIPAGYMPFENVEEQIRPVVEEEKKLEALFEQLKSANYTSLSALATATNEAVDTLNYVQFSSSRLENVGYEPVLNAVAAFAPQNSLQAVKGKNAIYLAEVVKRENAEPAPTESDVKLRQNANRSGLLRSQLLSTLISKSELKDNRYRFQ